MTILLKQKLSCFKPFHSEVNGIGARICRPLTLQLPGGFGKGPNGTFPIMSTGCLRGDVAYLNFIVQRALVRGARGQGSQEATRGLTP